jgi:hypothetical protein
LSGGSRFAPRRSRNGSVPFPASPTSRSISCSIRPGIRAECRRPRGFSWGCSEPDGRSVARQGVVTIDSIAAAVPAGIANKTPPRPRHTRDVDT